MTFLVRDNTFAYEFSWGALADDQNRANWLIYSPVANPCDSPEASPNPDVGAQMYFSPQILSHFEDLIELPLHAT